MTFTKSLRLSAGFLIAASLGACGNASSAEAPADVPAPASAASASSWNIVAEDSFIQFTAAQEGDAFTGSFGEFSGVINFDPDALGGSYVRIEIPLKSVDAGSKDRNSTLPGKVWFSTKAFPTAIYEATEIVSVGDGYEAKGTLTLKGATLPVELFFNLALDGDRAVMTGQATLDRTAWGVGAAPWDTDEWVSKAVEIDVQVTADKG
ncbi:YceI family protein [Litorimonas sp. WD9-15]|uniref:YceI family protein n=1 Tax=Litorimonas sp. WD9-15 TaxID=3418716 RepID=UPI003CFD6A8C